MLHQTINVPDLLTYRARALGDCGTRWLASLDELLAEVARNWRLRSIDQVRGGTEALVFTAIRDGAPAVVKIGPPGSLRRQALALRLADGVGYARLLAFDGTRDAVLLERLGEQLADCAASVDRQIEIICKTLKSAWRRVDDRRGLMTGAEKATTQARFIMANWDALNPGYDAKIRHLALAYARQRELAYDCKHSVLVHGDAHIWNTLRDQRGAGDTYKFVDPEGLFAEPALDLAISLREWRDELLAGDPLQIGRERCALLSALTGVDQEAIWQWGFVEQVSCGLLDLRVGDHAAAEQHFAIAQSWCV